MGDETWVKLGRDLGPRFFTLFLTLSLENSTRAGELHPAVHATLNAKENAGGGASELPAP